MKTTLVVLGLLLCGSVRAVDFKISTRSAVVNNGRIQASFGVTNGEADHFEGRVRVRAFLIPTRFPANGSPHAQPVLLPSQDFALDLAENRTQIIQLDAALPNVPADNYFLAAYVNSNVAVAEAQRNNNVTEDLFNLGTVVNNAPSADAQADDLYIDVPAVSVRSGSIGAAWRLFKRGAIDVTPSFYNLFLLANLAEKKLYVSTYEKSAHWLNMGTDVDAAGRTIGYDVYPNPVGFNHLKSGEYGILTWVDSRETLREADTSNNMNMRRVVVSRAHLATPSDGWFSSTGSGLIARTVSLVNDFAGQGTWTIDAASVPAGVTITPMNGGTSQLDSAIPLTVTVDPAAVPEGVTDITLQVQVIQGQTETLPVSFRVLKSASERMTGALNYSAALSVPKTQLVTGFIELPNLLAQPVHYQVASSSQALYGLGTFAVAPGEVRRVEFTADSRALQIGDSVLNLVVTSTGHAAPQNLPLTMTVTGR